MSFVLRCPTCRDKFPWEKTSKFPKHCPLCGDAIGSDRPDDDVVMPFIRTAKTKATDQVYRDMERGSETRMHAAAELSGAPASEMAALKITDLSDRRDSEVAAVPVNNTVTQFMAQNNVGGFQGAAGVGYSGAVQTGPGANAGARMRTVLQQYHGEISHGTAVSDCPANETQQPGYRRRG